jgi:multiple sugar transport system permease protein
VTVPKLSAPVRLGGVRPSLASVRGKKARSLAGTAVLLIIGCALMYPVVDAAIGCFEVAGTGQLTLRYWSELFTQVPVGTDMLVSAGLSVVVVALVLLFAVPCGYALAKLRFRGSRVVAITGVACLLIPFQSVVIPLYTNFAKLGLVGTLQGTALVYVGLGVPFAVFLMTSYFRALPDSLMESALVDGAGDFRAFVRIMLPLAKPALAVIAVLQFLGVWNDLLTALLFLPQQTRTIAVGLATVQALHVSDTQILVAGSILSAIPPVVVYLAFQRHLIAGLTMGAEK